MEVLGSSQGIQDINSAIALGLVAGKRVAFYTGVNNDIDTGSVPEDITDFGGVYTGFNAVLAERLDIVSSSADDTDVTGSGAHKMTVTGLDINYGEISEVVSLDGLNVVKTVNTYLRVNGPDSITAGDTNVGNITLTQETSGIQMDYMSAGIGRIRKCAFTVAAGKDFLITNAVGSNVATVSGSIAIVTSLLRKFGGVFVQGLPFDLSSGQGVANIDLSTPPLIVPEKADFVLRCISVANNNSAVSFSLAGTLHDRPS